jgi:hypothetical protein
MEPLNKDPQIIIIIVIYKMPPKYYKCYSHFNLQSEADLSIKVNGLKLMGWFAVVQKLLLCAQLIQDRLCKRRIHALQILLVWAWNTGHDLVNLVHCRRPRKQSFACRQDQYCQQRPQSFQTGALKSSLPVVSLVSITLAGRGMLSPVYF